MKTYLTVYWKIFAALLVIFVSGSGLGYVTAKRSQAGAGDMQAAPPSAEKTADWPGRTMDKLRAALDLTEEQEARILPHVAAVGERVFHERDRAMLQISLQVLEMHDSIEPYLDPEQKKKMVRSRENMQLHIRNRFSSLIDGTLP